MKKRVLSILVAVSLVAMMIIPFAAPVSAQGLGNSVGIDLSIAESTTTPTGTVHYTVFLTNSTGTSGAHDANVTVLFFKPGPSGALNDWPSSITLASGLLLHVGDEVVYSFDGNAGDATNPAAVKQMNGGLAVNLGAIPLSLSATVAYAEATFSANYINPDAPYSGTGAKNIPVPVTQPPPPPPRQTPASSTLGIVLMIAVLGGLGTFFLVRRNRRSQQQS
jgi:hypothetical protein